ncbi:MAG TPA: metallophosphoesterase [Pirellulaceae bacterium]|nr:metallophosphoesterase [Pirellulaceae bacterium]
MRLGILSDTHGHVQNTLAAVRMLQSLEVDELLHCGDLCSTEIPRLLADWPTHYVFGNCDVDVDAMRMAIAAAGGRCHDWFGDLTLGGRRIALLHGHEGKRFMQTIKSGEFDLVCYGHTHSAEFHHEGRTLVLNPGALYRANPHTVAILDLETMTPQIVPL